MAPVKSQDPIHIFRHRAHVEPFDPILFSNCQQLFQQVSSHMPVSEFGSHIHVLDFQIDLVLGKDFAARTNLAVRSTEFCQRTLDERDIRRGVGGGSGHG
jgi:hypothetical protein